MPPSSTVERQNWSSVIAPDSFAKIRASWRLPKPPVAKFQTS
jgi:hypothetical protein